MTLSVISIDDIKVTQFRAYSKGSNYRLKQEPKIMFVSGGTVYTCRGKMKMWTLFDALFPNDNLPRTPVNNDIFRPEGINSISAWQMLNEFLADSLDTGQQFILCRHEDGIVESFSPFDSLNSMYDLEVAKKIVDEAISAMPKDSQFVECSEKPFIYRDSKKAHIRTSYHVEFMHRASRLDVVDIGEGYYVRARGMIRQTPTQDIGLIKPTVVSKGDKDSLRKVVAVAIRMCQEHNTKDKAKDEISLRRLRTYEADLLLYERAWVL